MTSHRLLALVAAGSLAAALSGCANQVAVAPSTDEPVVASQSFDHGSTNHAFANAHGGNAASFGNVRIAAGDLDDAPLQLAYDPDLDVYVVVGQTDTFFSNGSFIRLHNGSWQRSDTREGPWRSSDVSSLPSGLRALANGNGANGGNGLAIGKPVW